MAPFKEIKKVMAPFNKINQKHLKPLFFVLYLQLKNMQCKFRKIMTSWIPYGSFAVNGPPSTPLLLVAPSVSVMAPKGATLPTFRNPGVNEKVFQLSFCYIFFTFKNTDWFDITDCNFFISKRCNQENFK